jgi:hypothetical protein
MAQQYITRDELSFLVEKRLQKLNKYDSEIHTLNYIADYVEEVMQAVENYCCIPEIYYTMRFIVVQLCTDYIIYDAEVAKDVSALDMEADPADLASVKVGDVTIGLGDKYRSNIRKTILNAHTYNLDDFILNYKEQLNRFRRIW